MDQSQLAELAKSLTPSEKDHVIEFAKSDFFNTSRSKKDVQLLLTKVLTADASTLKKETLFSELYPGQTFVQGKIEKIMVDAHKIIKNFLLVNYYLRPENEFNQKYDFVEILGKKGLENRFDSSLVKVHASVSQNPYKDSKFYYTKYLIEKKIRDTKAFRNQVRGDLNIPNTLFALEMFYLNEKLDHLNFYLLQRMVAKLPDHEFLGNMMDLDIPGFYLGESKILLVNFEIFKILRKKIPQIDEIKNLAGMLKKFDNEIDPESLRTYYTYLRNFIVIFSNNELNNDEGAILLFELYKDNLSRGYLHYEGYLHPNTFLAVTFTAIKVKEFKWVKEFLEKYRSALIEDNNSEDYYRMNYAYYLFGIKEFAKSLDFIPPNFNNIVYLMYSKRLELMLHYELQSNMVTYKLDNFKMFVSRTSHKILSEGQRQQNADFINLLHQIVYSTPGDLKRSNLLVKRVQEKKQAAEWRWLLEKARELRNR